MTPSSTSLNQLSATEVVLLLRGELKQHWQTGRRLLVEELLAQRPPMTVTEEALLDLIYQEIMVREEVGEHPVLEEYRQRFPHLADQVERQFVLHLMLKNSAMANLADPYATVPDGETKLSPPGKTPELGLTIHHYRIERELGRGAMGIVFKARDQQLQRIVALKLLSNQEYASREELQRFRTEAEILAQLQHPNIVQIFEVGEHQGKPYFVMEYVAGTTLQHKLQENPLAPQESARLVAVLAEAMQSAHERGIIHRDLKPANVLLSTEQVPKITDFGLARQGNSELTAPGAVMGTPSYMAPEQAAGQIERIGPASDVYALGAILFELLTGRAPFRGATVAVTLEQVLHHDPPTVRSLQPGVPRDLETIALKCLHKDPAKRFASASNLADDLHRFLRGESIHARPVGRIEKIGKWVRREPKVVGLLAVILLGTLGSFLAVVHLWQAERRENLSKQEQLYFYHILLANRELTAGKLEWAKDHLNQCPEPLREWEWHYLNYRCQNNNVTTVETPAAVISLALGPVHKESVVGLRGGLIAILDGQESKLEPFLGHLGNVNAVVFADQGRELFSGGEEGRICGWKLPSREKFLSLAEHQGPISCLAEHPQEPWMASTAFEGPDRGMIFVWDRRDGKKIHTLQKHSKAVTGLAFHPDGKLLASVSHDKSLILWDCQTGQIDRVLDGHRLPISCVAFSPDGSMIATSAGRIRGDGPKENHPDDDEIFVWNTALGSVLHRLHGHAQRAVCVAFAPGGKRLATAGWDHQIKIWDLRTGQEVLTLLGHRDAILGLAFDNQGTLVSGSLDKSVRFWRTTP